MSTESLKQSIGEFLNDLTQDKLDLSECMYDTVKPGAMAEKLKRAAPYNMFLTAIRDSKPTHDEPLSITMQEIFDESLGEIETSVQINFEIEIDWLLTFYHKARILDKPLLVLYGAADPDLDEINKVKSNVNAIRIKMPPEYAHSHSKIMLLGYADGTMRIVISTANLTMFDWHNCTQSLWMSPLLPALTEDAEPTAGESPTGFKADLLRYLVVYQVEQLEPWLERIRKTDFSAINVFLITSVPGAHLQPAPWGCTAIGTVLEHHMVPIDDSIPIVCQSSSIGSLGFTPMGWVQRDLLRHMRRNRSQVNRLRGFMPFKMIHPSKRNALASHDGGISPYKQEHHDRQSWLTAHLQQWKSDQRHRSQAMPHNKCYARFNEQEQSLYWFLLTSANISKAAWGYTDRYSLLTIANYEAGVLFLPKFVIGDETFPLCSSRNGFPPFSLPYDVPLTPYAADDVPSVGSGL
ncbi:probable tyrosyl-DNA phosphodiesterase isoform X1 [Drosophila albomicans]|uniref:Probable tyrosyl-DNA phosphodiesterase isoform X1 n=1 Tax=Drosophila albomicans TaxID=7291 RepID=A0A6P8XME1_DROAB|nr:probable tyrosyl-DNA phosphodiesterase isoform X1 [Drosophila albomicans]